ncbi:hypothetical protein B879_02783 [Cecembia lonarensis LW9]|uniref:Uncharacterized protein n=1 Tax=Cecembia lonarensis (strain CCUG 58316 / KCTC 22772 / LW9) TaxID=1225176 RepID=K1KWW2_CECL9|nr:hypothetical protein B879_02783 [Cecembia lonarensis LW9]
MFLELIPNFNLERLRIQEFKVQIAPRYFGGFMG